MSTHPARRGRVPEGSLFRSGPEGIWNFQVTLSGQTYRRSTGVRDRSVASEILHVFVETMKLRNPAFPPPAPITWKDLPPLWARLSQFRVKPRHILNVVTLVERHCGEIHDVYVNEVTQSQIDQVINAYRTRSSKGSVEAMARVLRLLLSWTEEHRFRLGGCPPIVLPNLQEMAERRRTERLERYRAEKRQQKLASASRVPSHPAHSADALPASITEAPSRENNPIQKPTRRPGGIWFPDERG